MALFTSTKLDSMEALLLDQLKDLYDAENRITDALPKMAEAACSPELESAFREHLRETEEHVRRLEECFGKLGKSAERQTCDAMKGLIKEGEHMMGAQGDDSVKDAALIAAAQRVEHYEMAGYGSARSFAQRIGRHDLADILQRTLDEEGAADEKLTRIAETTVNRQAARA